LGKSIKKKFPEVVDLNGNNWALGFESTWYNYLKTYNGEEKYRESVMNLYKIFAPSKEN